MTSNTAFFTFFNYIYTYTYIHTHIHTHIHPYIYIPIHKLGKHKQTVKDIQ